MKEDLKHIDDLFKKHLESLESNTSTNLWRKLSWMLFLKNLGVWIGLAIILSGFVVTYFILSPFDNISNNDNADYITNINNESIINNNINEENRKQNFNDNKRESEIDLQAVNSTDINKPILENPVTESFPNNANTEQHIEDHGLNQHIVKPNDIPNTYNYTDNYLSENNMNSISILPVLYLEKIFIEPRTAYINFIKEQNNSYPVSIVPDSGKTRDKPALTNKWELDLFVSPSYVSQSISEASGYEDYIQYRKNSESPAFSMGFGAEIKYSRKNFFLQSGVNYSNYDQQYQYETTTINNYSYYDIDTTWVWLVDPPFIEPYPIAIDSTQVYGSKSITNTTSGKNQYRYLEIPLLFGYQHRLNKLNIEISTGVSYGFFIAARGKLPDLSNSSFLDLSKQTDLFGNNMNYLLYLGLEYKVNKKFSILIKPNYKQNLKSIFNSDYPVTQKFTTFGIIFGIRINL